MGVVLRSFVIGIIFVAACSQANAARIWLSDTTTPSAITNPTITLSSVGATAPLYLFANVEGSETITGLGLAIANATGGIASGALESWENPAVGPFERWNTSTATGLPYSFTPGELIDLNAVSVVGTTGLSAAVASLDPTLDTTTGGLLVGRINVTGMKVGTTDVFFTVGPMTISGSGFSTVLFGADDMTAVDPTIVVQRALWQMRR